MGINGEQLLQMSLLLLQFLNNHPRCEPIHSIHAHLYYAWISLAGLRVSLRQLSLLKILGHLKCLVDLIFDLRPITCFKCLNFLQTFLDNLPAMSNTRLMHMPSLQVIFRGWLDPSCSFLTSEELCHSRGSSALKASLSSDSVLLRGLPS